MIGFQKHYRVKLSLTFIQNRISRSGLFTKSCLKGFNAQTLNETRGALESNWLLTVLADPGGRRRGHWHVQTPETWNSTHGVFCWFGGFTFFFYLFLIECFYYLNLCVLLVLTRVGLLFAAFLFLQLYNCLHLNCKNTSMKMHRYIKN